MLPSSFTIRPVPASPVGVDTKTAKGVPSALWGVVVFLGVMTLSFVFLTCAKPAVVERNTHVRSLWLSIAAGALGFAICIASSTAVRKHVARFVPRIAEIPFWARPA